MMQEPVVPMCFLRVRCIGVMHMIDQGEQDDKIIAVHIDDPEYKHMTDISQVPKHRLAEIRCAPSRHAHPLALRMRPRSLLLCFDWRSLACGLQHRLAVAGIVSGGVAACCACLGTL